MPRTLWPRRTKPSRVTVYDIASEKPRAVARGFFFFCLRIQRQETVFPRHNKRPPAGQKPSDFPPFCSRFAARFAALRPRKRTFKPLDSLIFKKFFRFFQEISRFLFLIYNKEFHSFPILGKIGRFFVEFRRWIGPFSPPFPSGRAEKTAPLAAFLTLLAFFTKIGNLAQRISL